MDAFTTLNVGEFGAARAGALHGFAGREAVVQVLTDVAFLLRCEGIGAKAAVATVSKVLFIAIEKITGPGVDCGYILFLPKAGHS